MTGAPSDAAPVGVRVEELPVDRLDDLLPDLEDLDHDLGKYIVLQTRFCGLDAADAELREALRADLLATRQRGDRRWTAWELWATLRPAGLDADPRVRRLDVLLAELSTARFDGDRESLLAIAGRADEVRRTCRALLDAARARLTRS